MKNSKKMGEEMCQRKTKNGDVVCKACEYNYSGKLTVYNYNPHHRSKTEQLEICPNCGATMTYGEPEKLASILKNKKFKIKFTKLNKGISKILNSLKQKFPVQTRIELIVKPENKK